MTIDLFGADQSSNAATFYSSGLKGRYEEGKRDRRPCAEGPDLQGARGAERPAGREGSADAQRAERGAARRLHQGLGGRRRPLEQGAREGRHAARACRCRTRRSTARSARSPASRCRPTAASSSEAEWAAQEDEWLPTPDDFAFVASLMGRVRRAGQVRRTGSRRRRWASTASRSISSTSASAERSADREMRSRRQSRRHGDAGGHQAAPDRPRDLHPLQHLRGDLPGRRDHARRPQLRRPRRRVQPAAWPASRRARPARSTTGAPMPKARAYSIEEQLTWDELPRRAHARAARRPKASRPTRRRRGRSPSRCSRSQPDAAAGEAPFNSRGLRRDACRRGRPRMPTPTCTGRRARPPPPWSATSTAPRPASRARRTTSCSTSARCRSRCSKGQSIGIVPPGVDARGKPHVARQYSVASPRNGERPGYNNVSLTVKRVTEDHQGRPVRGVGSQLRLRPQGRRHGAGDRPVRPAAS